MLRSLVVVTSVIATAQIAFAQPPSAADPIVQVGLFGYAVDGRSTSAAYDTEPSLAGIVYASGTLCRVGAGNNPPPADAMHAWKFSGTVISKTAEEAVVQLNWQRIVDRGQPATTPENSVQLTLRAGDRVPLDTVVPDASACLSATGVFEARYVSRLWRMERIEVRPAGAQAAARPKAAASSTAGMHVDLWLVHSAPGREDEVFHQMVRAPEEKADFAFAPVAIGTPRGQATVQVKGSFNVTADRQLLFLMNRRVSYADQPARDVVHDISGSGRTISRMPTADEVLSFELPPIRRTQNDPPLPNQFSVRFRVTPN